jgi:hypothetical protein
LGLPFSLSHVLDKIAVALVQSALVGLINHAQGMAGLQGFLNHRPKSCDRDTTGAPAMTGRLFGYKRRIFAGLSFFHQSDFLGLPFCSYLCF